MKEYISKDNISDILSGFYGTATPAEENLLVKIWVAVKDAPPAPVMEVRPLRHDSRMETLLKEAGWE